MERLGSRQAARALGITAITVRRHLGRARARLREILLQGEKIDPTG
jgi:DNA-directed RNA polymerase specialized sigma24 family protein